MAFQGSLFRLNDNWADHPSLDETERMFAVALSVTAFPGGNQIWKMLRNRKPSEIYRHISGNCRPVSQQHVDEKYSLYPLDASKEIIERSEKKSLRVLTYWDPEYPALLREILFPPMVLYVKGELLAGNAVAIVGTRKSDARSSANARRISRDLAARGYVIVSGMAVGIDREAHLGALDENGRTVGVMANGADIIYPWPNRDLYRLIDASAGSALVTEYPPGIRAGKWAFVRRNRIISGLCAGTVVVKAGERSGALITARHAMEQNREVFACPGNSFDEEYAGCQRLIRCGAVLVSCSNDIVSELSFPVNCNKTYTGYSTNESGKEPAPIPAVTDHVLSESGTLEARILQMLSISEYDIDSITRAVEEPPGEVNEAVVSLELSEKILRNGNMISKR